jgi:hypothetical protein
LFELSLLAIVLLVTPLEEISCDSLGAFQLLLLTIVSLVISLDGNCSFTGLS